jgi:hypothetical protein
MDCFVASRLAMSGYTFAISQRAAPEVCMNLVPPKTRGRRECRAPAGTRGLVCKM